MKHIEKSNLAEVLNALGVTKKSKPVKKKNTRFAVAYCHTLGSAISLTTLNNKAYKTRDEAVNAIEAHFKICATYHGLTIKSSDDTISNVHGFEWCGIHYANSDEWCWNYHMGREYGNYVITEVSI